MNIEKVYLCDIYEMGDITYNEININVDKGNGSNYDNITCIKRKTTFAKKALVYYSILYGCFIDLETKEKYRLGYAGCNIGDLFVDIKREKVYGKELIGSERKHYSRKKVLKKYEQYKEGCIDEHK